MPFNQNIHNGLCWAASVSAEGIATYRPAGAVNVKTIETLETLVLGVTRGCADARKVIRETRSDRHYDPAYLLALETFPLTTAGLITVMQGQPSDSARVAESVASLIALFALIHDPLNFGLPYPLSPHLPPLPIDDEPIPNPHWMGDHAAQLGEKSLKYLVIPGTHDSGTYSIRSDSAYGPDREEWQDWLNRLAYTPAFGGIAGNIVANWSRTQPSRISAQLNAGIRYFDIRVALHDLTLCVTHTLLGAPLSEILDDVSTFIKQNPKEIVILDFNHFYGMSSIYYKIFRDSLQYIFGNKVVPSTFGPNSKIKEILGAGHQVIILLDKGVPELQGYGWSGNKIRSIWRPPAQDVDALLQRMEGELNRARTDEEQLMVLQAVLTPDGAMGAKGVVPGQFWPGSLAEVAHRINARALDFITSRIDADKSKPNIVIMDWFTADRRYATALYRMNLEWNGSILKTTENMTEFMRTGEYRVSKNLRFFLILQSDGNLCVYRGSGPNDQKGLLWHTNRLGDGGEFFAIMQHDGNLCVYKGTGPTDDRGYVWGSQQLHDGACFTIIQDDGNLCVYKGKDPSEKGGLVWNSGRTG